MIVSCPQCNRRYRLNNEYLDKYIRCVCSAVLKVSDNQQNKSIDNLPEVTQSSTSKSPSIDSLIFPDLVHLLDLAEFEMSDQLSDASVDALPDIEAELPSFDDDEFEDVAIRHDCLALSRLKI